MSESAWRVPFAALILYLSSAVQHASAQEMTASIACPSRLCTIVLTGQVTANSPEMLAEALSDTSDIGDILLQSPGGNLGAGVVMGRMIRDTGLTTRVGGPGGDEDYAFKDKCESACAYMFLGGANRSVVENGQLGFHRFSRRSQEQESVVVDNVLGDAQKLSSQMLTYIIEMGVDPRIFVEASGYSPDEMFYPDRETLLEFDLVTPQPFSHFFLDPYKNGIVAASKRQVPTQIHDELLQLTALCIGGTPYLLSTSSISFLAPASFGFYFSKDIDDYEDIPASKVEVFGSSLRVELKPDQALKLQRAEYIRTQFDISPADGGEQTFKLELNEDDRRYLEAAFKLCI